MREKLCRACFLYVLSVFFCAVTLLRSNETDKNYIVVCRSHGILCELTQEYADVHKLG